MKHLWILNHYAQEPSRQGGIRHYSLAKGLLSYGWQTYIIAASVEPNTGYQRLKSDENYRLECNSGVPFLWLKTPTYSGNGLGRIVNMLCYTIRALIPSNTKDIPSPDVIVGSSVHPFAAWAGAIIAKRFKVPFIFEVRDLWPQTLVEYGWISKSGLTAKLLYLLERWLYRNANRIIVLLPQAADYIINHGGDIKKVVWIPNGVNIKDFPESLPSNTEDVFTFMYFGSHGNANGLDNMIQAMALLQKRNLAQPVQLRLVGAGPLKSALMEQAKQLKLNNVYFAPPVSKNSVPILASEADAFLITFPNRPLYRFGISPNKLFDYMAAARPTLIATNAANNPIRAANGGVTVPPEDPFALADAMEELIRLPFKERIEMGKNARDYVAKHNEYSVLSKKFSAVLKEVYYE